MSSVADPEFADGDTTGADLSRTGNRAFATPIFVQKFGRPPLPPTDPGALINDLIFARMIEPCWPALERTLVDKYTAKDEVARLCPGLQAPETLATIEMAAVRSPGELFDRLLPFIGTDAIAKPAHASGGTLFLRGVTAPAELTALFELASADYALVMREMQYAGLPTRVIVEALVPTARKQLPDDYKFHCVRGDPLLCQIDHARFGASWSRVLRVPGFAPMDPNDGLVAPASVELASADRLTEMTAIARALSAPFSYVRVDLYDGLDNVYFGELTFTPAASLGIAPSAAGCHRETATHRAYSRMLMQAF